MADECKPKNEVFGEILVKVTKLPPSALVFRQQLGSGETPSGEKFEIDTHIPTGSFYISFPGSKPFEHYLIEMNEIVSAALDLREKKKAIHNSYPEVGEDGAIPGVDLPCLGNAGDKY